MTSKLKIVTLYFWNILRWIDCGANCIIFLGSPYETISQRAAKARNAGQEWGCVLCKWLDKVSKGHCDKALVDRCGDYAIITDPNTPEN